MGVPLDLAVKQQGFNIIGYFADDQPNFHFNGYFVKRAWAEKNRPLVVRFMKAMASTMRWMMDNRAAACGYLSKEMAISVEHSVTPRITTGKAAFGIATPMST